MALALLLGGCAAPQRPSGSEAAEGPAAPPRCLRIDRIDNWRVIDSRRMLVYGRPAREAWLMEFFGSCQGIGFAETLAFRARGTELLCGDPGEEVLLRGARCAVRSFRRVNPAEEATLTQPGVRDDIGKLPPAATEPRRETGEDTP